MSFKISPKTLEKLRDKHNVAPREIQECFYNRTGPSFLDTREDNATDPPTLWFVAETDTGRLLKVVYIAYSDYYAIKTAFEPQDGSDRLYEKLCATRSD